MEISAVGGAAAPSRQRGLDSLKSEDFFRILVTEMQQQDPFEPNDTSDMVNQVSQIRGIELSSQLSTTLDALARQQRANGIGELIGKYVMAQPDAVDGAPVEGLVVGVRFDEQGAAVLELDSGQFVRAADVERVTTLEQVEAERALGTPAPAASGATATEPEKAGGQARSKDGGFLGLGYFRV